MNLALKDIRHGLFRFVLTCFGLGLLMTVVLAMIGIYNGLVADALAIVKAPAADLWVVEAGTKGPFAEASSIPADTRDTVARMPGVAEAGAVKSASVAAVVVRLQPGADVALLTASLRQWKHLAALSQADQENILLASVVDRARRQIGLFLGILLAVSAVVIALIIYTMTMEKLKQIATLKLIGAPDRTIVGLIVQQALILGTSGWGIGLVLILTIKDGFPRRVVLEPFNVAALAGIIFVVCIAASGLGVRAAMKVDPATALGS